MTQKAANTSRKRVYLVAGAVLAGAALLVMFILPAETGYDPTGVGAATGLTKIAAPDNPEFERGKARMKTQDVLALTETQPVPLAGASDHWEYQLGPFESIEFKYTIPQGAPVAFHWKADGPLHFDMHAHPFEGGVDLTESYAIDDLPALQGTYTPAFTGIHGWFWENRSMNTVILTLDASGGMTGSTVFGPAGTAERPVEGAAASPEGTVEGHTMQSDPET